MTDAIRLTVEVGKRVYHTGHSEENKNPNRNNGKTYSKATTTQWPPSSDSINRNDSVPVGETRSFTVNLSKTQLSPEAERWNWEETKTLQSTSTLVFDQIPEFRSRKASMPGARPAQPDATSKTPQQAASREPPKAPGQAKSPGAAPGQAKPPGATPGQARPPGATPGQAKPPGATTPEKPKTPGATTPEKPKTPGATTPEKPKTPVATTLEQADKVPDESKKEPARKPGKRSKKHKPSKNNAELIALEKMKAKKTKQPRPCKCGKAKDVTLLLKDLCECDTLNLKRINLVKLFTDYQKENKVGNPLPYMTDSLIVYKNRMSRPQVKERVEWTVIPRKGKKGVQFKKPKEAGEPKPKPPPPPGKNNTKMDEETKKIEEQFKKMEEKDKKKTEEGGKPDERETAKAKKKVEVTVKYAEESLVTLFKNTSKKESMYNLTEEQLEKLNSD